MKMKWMFFLGAIVALSLASCNIHFEAPMQNEAPESETSGNGNPGGEAPDGENQDPQVPTYVIFDNGANPFSVSVYLDAQRLPGQRLGDKIEAGQRSEAIRFAPSQRTSFFPRFHFELESHPFFFDPPSTGSTEVLVRQGETTTVPIRPLSTVVSPDTPLVNDNEAHLRIYNRGYGLMNLAKGTQVIHTNSGEEGANPGEWALFTVVPAGDFRILEGGNVFPFPSGLVLQKGHFYVIEFDGFAVTLVRKVPITLESLAP